MSKQKVTLRIEEGEVELLKEKYNTDNQSEAIRLAIMECLATEDLEKVKTLFSYMGKKHRELAEKLQRHLSSQNVTFLLIYFAVALPCCVIYLGM